LPDAPNWVALHAKPHRARWIGVALALLPHPPGGGVTKELLLKQLAPEFRNKEFGAFNFKDPGDDSLATSGGGHSFRILIGSHRHTEVELMSVMTLTSVS
jgi:hypothetical protein